jgi:hypothetical protein
MRALCAALAPRNLFDWRILFTRVFNRRKTHLAFITKLNVCLSLRCDCLRDGDTDGVTVDNMQVRTVFRLFVWGYLGCAHSVADCGAQTLRKPLERCLLGSCPLFPFDLADQHDAVAVRHDFIFSWRSVMYCAGVDEQERAVGGRGWSCCGCRGGNAGAMGFAAPPCA